MWCCSLLKLAWTCYNFYQSTPTKLARKNHFFHSGFHLVHFGIAFGS
ncbi:hypothetical protein ACB092_03G027000 [Castanea dentata]